MTTPKKTKNKPAKPTKQPGKATAKSKPALAKKTTPKLIKGIPVTVETAEDIVPTVTKSKSSTAKGKATKASMVEALPDPGPVVEKDIYHVGLEADRDALHSLLQRKVGSVDDDMERFTIDGYVKSGKPKVMLDDDVLAEDRNSDLYVIKDGKIYYVSDTEYLGGAAVVPRGLDYVAESRAKDLKIFNDVNFFVGVLLRKPIHGLDAALGIIVNGDEGANQLVDELTIDVPVISFKCLGRFYADNNEEKTAERLIRGECQVVDFTHAEMRVMTKQESAAARAFREYERNVTAGKKLKKTILAPTPPERGFVMVGDRWHRSSTVLFYDQKSKFSILMGVDEDTYFGCQLADNPQTVADAYTSLIPPILRDQPHLLRQGEWFFVKVPEQDVPLVEQSMYLFDRLVMPVETSEAHPHWLTTGEYDEDRDSYRMRNDETRVPVMGRVGADGTIYAFQPKMYHCQHETIEDLSGWYRFYRNTAIRSFSEQGVD
jgi:hypothetical protein